MRIHRNVVGLAAVAGALAVAAPASADTYTEIPLPNAGPAFGVQAFAAPTQTGDDLGVTVTQTGRAENLGDPTSSTDTRMGVECAAQSTGAAGTGISSCYLQGLFTGTIYPVGDSNANPGTTDANAAATVTPITMEPFKVCVQTRVLLRDGSKFYTAPLSCSTN